MNRIVRADGSETDAPVHRPGSRRVAWITPDYPPDRGGVSDHSHAMVSELRSLGHDVRVYSRPHEAGFDLIASELAAYHPNLVVVAYVPLAYGPRTGGISPSFVIWCTGLRKRLRCRALLLAHEANLPAAYLWGLGQLKLAALGAAQIAQFSYLISCFDSVLFSNIGARREWAQRSPHASSRFHTIRICSNIPFYASAAPAAELMAAGHDVPRPTILFFGTGHQSVLLDYVDHAFRTLLATEPNAYLVVVGMTRDKLHELRPSFSDLGERVLALGYVAAAQVSLWLQVASLVLAPLAEGVSARKGTVMAALQHGQCVVTTRGVHTCDDIAWDEICVLTPLTRGDFAEACVEALRDVDRRARVGRAAQAEYEAHASAGVTASRILEYASREQG